MQPHPSFGYATARKPPAQIASCPKAAGGGGEGPIGAGKKFKRDANLRLVTTGLDPVVHAEVQLLRVFRSLSVVFPSAWIAGSSPAMTIRTGSGTPRDASSTSRTHTGRGAPSEHPRPAGMHGGGSPLGVPPRLSPRGLSSPKARLEPGFLGGGKACDPEKWKPAAAHHAVYRAKSSVHPLPIKRKRMAGVTDLGDIGMGVQLVSEKKAAREGRQDSAVRRRSAPGVRARTGERKPPAITRLRYRSRRRSRRAPRRRRPSGWPRPCARAR